MEAFEQFLAPFAQPAPINLEPGFDHQLFGEILGQLHACGEDQGQEQGWLPMLEDFLEDPQEVELPQPAEPPPGFEYDRQFRLIMTPKGELRDLLCFYGLFGQWKEHRHTIYASLPNFPDLTVEESKSRRLSRFKDEVYRWIISTTNKQFTEVIKRQKFSVMSPKNRDYLRKLLTCEENDAEEFDHPDELYDAFKESNQTLEHFLNDPDSRTVSCDGLNVMWCKQHPLHQLWTLKKK
jgi:hypothetical protein